MNYYVPIGDELEQRLDRKQWCDRYGKSRYVPRILGRRFALTRTANKYMEIGISVGFMSTVELLLADTRGSKMILPYTTWTAFIEDREDIVRFLQSKDGSAAASSSSSLSICDLVMTLVKICDENIVKLVLRDSCLYMKPTTVLFLFELEHCVKLEYHKLRQNTHAVSERFNLFVSELHGKLVAPEKNDAVNILRETYDKTSAIDCELLAYAVDELLCNTLRLGDV